MKRIGEHRGYILYQSPSDGHIEAWKTNSPEIVRDGDNIRKFSDRDVERIITTATTYNEALKQLDRKLKRPRVSKTQRLVGQVDLLDSINELEEK